MGIRFVLLLVLVASWQINANSAEGNAVASKREEVVPDSLSLAQSQWWPFSSGPAPAEEMQATTEAPSDGGELIPQSFTTAPPEPTSAPRRRKQSEPRRRRRSRRRKPKPTPKPTPRPRPRPRPRPTPKPAQCTKGKKDIMIMIDASKSVGGGWSDEANFAARLINEITRNGNPDQHALNVHYFNTDTVPIGPGIGSDAKFRMANSVGTFSTDGAKLAQAVKSLQYTSIVAGATDHPQCFETATDAFKKVGRNGAKKVLILITDGATHKGKCKGVNEGKGAKNGGIEMVAKKIGRCRKRNLLLERSREGKGFGGKGGKGGKGRAPEAMNMEGVDRSHPCGQPTGNDPPCATQCMCGLYTAALFKDLGYELNLVGITNGHHVGQTDAGVFNKIMRSMASPGRAYLAKNFKSLNPLVKPLVSDVMCK